jgi:translation initiation factor IF-3
MINERLLRLDQVRLMGQDGEQLGVVSSREALQLAQQADLDLVLVAPNAEPPVCKIVDYGKHKYDQSKAKKDHKKKVQEVKGVKLRPGTDTHDIGVLVKKAKKFLDEGHKVRVTCVFRFRELAHPEVGRDKLHKIAAELETFGKVDREPILNGREMVIVVNPVTGKKKDAKAENKKDGGQAIQSDRDREDHAPEGL